MKRLSVILAVDGRDLRLRIGNAGRRAGNMDPEGPARIAAEPPHTPSHRPGNGYDNGPFAALGAIFAGRTDAITSVPAARTAPRAKCQVISRL